MKDSLGALYRAQGKYALAESLFEKNLEARRRVLGEQHPEALSAMASLGVTYLRQGKASQAEPLFTKLLEVRRRVIGPQSPATTEALVLLGLAQFQLRKYADTERVVSEALIGYEKARIDDWRPHRAKALLGAALAGQGRLAEAELLLLSGYEGMATRQATIPFENRTELNLSVNRIVQLYRDLGDTEKVDEWAKKLKASAPARP